MAACMSQPEKFTEKRLVIARKQTVRIEELGMSITNWGCKLRDLFGKVYCDLIVKTKDSTWHFGQSFSPLYINNLKLVIDQTNIPESKQDSIPPGSCRIIITRLDDLSR
jgi:hypothetical protein